MPRAATKPAAPASKPAHRSADIRVFVGASGMGKSASIRKHLQAAAPARLLIVDPMDECADLAQLASLGQIGRALAGRGGFRLRYRPVSLAQSDAWARFDALCQAAYEGRDVTLYVEELSQFTTASYAPPAWTRVSTMGRKRGLSVLAATQRPALCDKNLLGNCTHLRAFAMRYPEDRRAVAKVIGCTDTDLAGLAPLHFIERDFLVQKTTRGELRF